jgi:hypothetical protein
VTVPYDDPDPDDPSMLVGVVLPGDAGGVAEMAASFADEFAQLGLSRDEILALFRQPFYAAAHGALETLGEGEIGRIVDESLGLWSRFHVVVRDAPDEMNDAEGPLRQGKFLRVLR